MAKRIVFIHPDLGIGGAERLVIDAAVSLQSLGHHVTVLTSHCDPQHCFEEARDGTLDVRVRGNAIFPPSLLGRFNILLAILRQLSLVLIITLFTSELRQLNPDVFFVDQLSACVPLLRLLAPRAKILFYGHFPDRLLAKKGGSPTEQFLKSLYRTPFDALESWSTACADSIVVNSKFTRSVFKQNFSTIKSRELKVVYPCVDTTNSSTSPSDPPLWPDKKLLLSINRYEGKKNLALALQAFAALSPQDRQKAKLVIAGGYDARVVENARTHTALQDLASELQLRHATFPGRDVTGLAGDSTHEVLFLLSVPETLKRRLLDSARLLLYTPAHEHFGIVPLEAMLAGVPVLATNSGGPLETIYDGRTGWLRSPENVSAWTDVLRKPLIPSSEGVLLEMGRRGRERVLAEFSRKKMTEVLDAEVKSLCESGGKARPTVLPLWLLITVAVAILAVVLAVAVALRGTS